MTLCQARGTLRALRRPAGVEILARLDLNWVLVIQKSEGHTAAVCGDLGYFRFILVPRSLDPGPAVGVGSGFTLPSGRASVIRSGVSDTAGGQWHSAGIESLSGQDYYCAFDLTFGTQGLRRAGSITQPRYAVTRAFQIHSWVRGLG